MRQCCVILSNILNDNDIGVDLLVTIDIKSGYDTIKPNVKKAINYYQTNDFLISGEDIESSWFNKTSNVSNVLVNSYNGERVSHTNIDNHLEEEIYNLIK